MTHRTLIALPCSLLTNMNKSNEFTLLLEAAGFSARAHKNQTRKDKQTPYAAHTFRVCLILRHLFGVENLTAMTAALLHDTIEDTATDFDDIEEKFGKEVAEAVSALTKDMRLQETEREAIYIERLRNANDVVRWCKLADIFDNLTDSSGLPPTSQKRTLARTKLYLDAIADNCPTHVMPAFAIVQGLWNNLSAAA